MTSDVTWAEAARLRQGFYRLFGSAMLPPNPERMEGLKAGTALLDDESTVDAFPFAAEWHELAATISTLPATADLGSSYIRLFELCTTEPPCFPTETAYESQVGASETATIMRDLMAVYREAGLRVTEQVRQTCDHIAVELEFMSHLCSVEHEISLQSDQGKLDALLGEEKKFLERHLIRWMGAFVHRVQAAGVGLYPMLVGTAWSFVQQDYNFVTALERLHVAGSAK